MVLRPIPSRNRRVPRRNGKGKRSPRKTQRARIVESSRQVARQLTSSWDRPHELFVADGTNRTIVSDGVSDSIYNYTFALGAVDVIADIAQNFQFYKILEVSVVYEPIVTQVVAFSGEGAPTFIPPNIAYSFAPYSTVPSSYAGTVQRGDSAIVSSMREWRTSFKPVPLIRAFDSLTVDGFVNMGPQWITTERNDVPHYGFFIAMQPTGGLGATPEFGGRLTFYYRVVLKNPIARPGV
jgi:hypothetical protein